MYSHVSPTLFTCVVALSTLGEAYKCAPTVPNEQCLSSAHAFSAGLFFPNKTSVVATPKITLAQLYERAARYTCAPTAKAADCLASAVSFSSRLSTNLANKTSTPASATPIITAPELYVRAAQYTCAPTIPRSECLASASSFSAWLQNKTASAYLTTTNFITTATPVSSKAAPCTLTKPYGTDVIILDACPTRLPPPSHRPIPLPVGFTPQSDVNFMLPTPTEERIRQLATPTGKWSTCVQNNMMSCTNALCTSDTLYAPRCTDYSFPKSEGRELCINGLPAKCEGFHCEVLEEAGRRENMREGRGGGEWDVHAPVDNGVCRGWTGKTAVRAPARTGAPAPTKMCIGKGLGKAANPNDRVWQNGECYTLKR